MTNLLYIAWVDYRDYKLHCLRLPNVALIFVFAMRNGCDVKEWDVRYCGKAAFLGHSIAIQHNTAKQGSIQMFFFLANPTVAFRP